MNWSKRARSNWPVRPRKVGSSTTRRASSLSLTAKPERAGALVQDGLGNGLGQHLPVEPDRARLGGRDGTADLAAELLHPVHIGLAELLDADLGVADPATVDRPKPRKMSPMPQIAKLMAIRPTIMISTVLPSQLDVAFLMDVRAMAIPAQGPACRTRCPCMRRKVELRNRPQMAISSVGIML